MASPSILLLILACWSAGAWCSHPEQDIAEESVALHKRQSNQEWFAPRLGRELRPFDDDSEVAGLIREFPWALVSLRGGKRQTTYTPRLGRESGELPEDAEEVDQRSPPFAPRLGRRQYLPFAPRLGRDPSH